MTSESGVSALRRLLRRVVTTFWPGRAEAELAREIHAHLQLLEDQFVNGGMTRTDARDAARRAFGGVEQVKERQRDARGFRWLAGWPMDLKLGARMLVKSPGLTVVAVTALAVAIGAGAAYLEFTRDLMSPTLPVANADGIVGVQIWDPQRGAPQTQAIRDFAVWRDEAGIFELLGADRGIDRHIATDDGRLERARGVEISASAFRLFPNTPLLGRTLRADDEHAGALPVVVIGADLWQALFDADPNAIGRTVRVGPAVHTVVGVMPQDFGFPTNQNLWLPLNVQAAGLSRGDGPAIRMFGRLKPGISAAAAQARLQGLLTSDGTANAGSERRHSGAELRVDVRPYLDSLLLKDRNGAEFIVFQSANLVFVMLLCLCGANVATLVFARIAMREAEITVRSALGASRGRISAQLFAEALVLSSVAALVGLGVARFVTLWGKQIWVRLAGQPRPFWWDDDLSPQTILYAFALALFAALIVGVVPALKATGAQLQGRLRQAGATQSSLKFGNVWTGVMITQVALTVVFLTTVASFGWVTLRSRLDYDVTFARERYLTARLVWLSDPAGGEGPISQAAYRSVADKLTSLPGIVNATYASELPGAIESAWCGLEFSTPEVVAIDRADLGSRCQRVGPNYFETIGLPLVAGRSFTESEIAGDRPVAIVDETFVRLMLGGRNAIGLMVRQPPREGSDATGPWHEIIGVVKDVSVITRKTASDAMLYRPATVRAASPAQVIIRTRAAAAPMAPGILAALSSDRDIRLSDVASLDHVAASGGLALRFLLRIVTVVGAIALLLSTAGIYALVSFTLTRRKKEIGIRAALGAAPHRIIANVLARACAQIGAGVLAGAVPGAAIMTFGIGGMGIRAGVSATLAVCAFVVVVALITCATPLARALRIDPTQALRVD